MICCCYAIKMIWLNRVKLLLILFSYKILYIFAFYLPPEKEIAENPSTEKLEKPKSVEIQPTSIVKLNVSSKENLALTTIIGKKKAFKNWDWFIIEFLISPKNDKLLSIFGRGKFAEIKEIKEISRKSLKNP